MLNFVEDHRVLQNQIEGISKFKGYLMKTQDSNVLNVSIKNTTKKILMESYANGKMLLIKKDEKIVDFFYVDEIQKLIKFYQDSDQQFALQFKDQLVSFKCDFKECEKWIKKINQWMKVYVFQQGYQFKRKFQLSLMDKIFMKKFREKKVEKFFYQSLLQNADVKFLYDSISVKMTSERKKFGFESKKFSLFCIENFKEQNFKNFFIYIISNDKIEMAIDLKLIRGVILRSHKSFKILLQNQSLKFTFLNCQIMVKWFEQLQISMLKQRHECYEEIFQVQKNDANNLEDIKREILICTQQYFYRQCMNREQLKTKIDFCYEKLNQIFTHKNQQTFQKIFDFLIFSDSLGIDNTDNYQQLLIQLSKLLVQGKEMKLIQKLDKNKISILKLLILNQLIISLKQQKLPMEEINSVLLDPQQLEKIKQIIRIDNVQLYKKQLNCLFFVVALKIKILVKKEKFYQTQNWFFQKPLEFNCEYTRILEKDFYRMKEIVQDKDYVIQGFVASQINCLVISSSSDMKKINHIIYYDQIKRLSGKNTLVIHQNDQKVMIMDKENKNQMMRMRDFLEYQIKLYQPNYKIRYKLVESKIFKVFQFQDNQIQ